MTQNDRDDDGVLDLLGRHYNNLTSFCHGILQKHFYGTSQLETFFSVLGIGPIPWIIMSEILSSNVKGFAGSVATLGNWLGSWAMTMNINIMLQWSSIGTFVIYSVICIFTMLFVAFSLPETKGRTLEEIEESFI